MYSYISGTLEEEREDEIVVDNNGIGYRILVPSRIHEELPGLGSPVKIYTYLHVREDAFLLYGFSSQEEMEMFCLLLNVSGIGPKGALALLSAYSANEIQFAVMSEDDRLLAKANGIGRKTAQRLIIELKDKISVEEAVEGIRTTETAAIEGNCVVKREAMEALISLGYSSSDAAKVLAGIEISEETDVETLLRQALKNMAMI